MRRIFFLSPASTSGRRAQLLFRDAAAFPLALELRAGGSSIGEVFSFLSGLYFRGKLTYARAFAQPARVVPSILVITPDRGLVSPDLRITLADLTAFSNSDVNADNPRYRRPLERDASGIDEAVKGDVEVILLGSIATGKYVDVLLDVFGERLLFPQEFVGRGDMSRGGLLLRCVDAMSELTYVPVAGALRKGQRPPKLEPR
ncbi:MAG TPA: hypothetical protein VGC44_09830 [Longimicrobiales bacterium]